MGLFTKKTKTSFKRNEAGEIVDVKRTEEKPRISFKRKSKTPLFDKLEKKYYEQHPEETKRYKLKKAGSKLLAGFDQMADNYVKNTRKRSSSKKSTSTRYIIRGGKAYPIAKSSERKEQVRRRAPEIKPFTMDDFYDPFSTNISRGKKKKRKELDLFDNSGFW